MSRRLRIEQGLETMYADEEGRIERPGLVSGSDSWRIVGAVTRNNFGAIVREWALAEVLDNPGAIPWRFKNGKQRTHVLDFDHGTIREWCNPTHRVEAAR